MKNFRKMAACLLTIMCVLAMGMTAMAATNYKADILSEMDAAAADLGVQNSTKYKNARASVAAYEGTITEKQYQAALDEIAALKSFIESHGVENVRNDADLMAQAIKHVQNAGAAVGVTIIYDGEGAGHVSANTEGNAGPQVSNPIKQTGITYTSTIILIAAALVVVSGSFIIAKKRNVLA